MRRLQRTEGNAIFNFLTCAPLILIIVLAQLALQPIIGDIVGIAVVFPLIIFFMIFSLWIPSKAFKHWYLEIDEDGFLYKAFFMEDRYSWDDVIDIETRKSEGFTGSYDDEILITTKDKIMSFVLIDFGLRQKGETTEFIQDVLETWKAYPGQ